MPSAEGTSSHCLRPPVALTNEFCRCAAAEPAKVRVGCGDAGMAESIANRRQGGSLCLQLQSKAVAKRVRMDALPDPGPGGEAWEQVPDVA